MLATLGDLLEDVVIRVDDPVNVASDTSARIERRRGGSAANVAAAAVRAGSAARFLGQVGDDAIGRALVDELTTVGVDVSFVRYDGRTGTIAVLVDATGERTMLTDRGACTALEQPDVAWLDGVSELHVPLYSLVDDPLATTALTVIGWAHDRGVDVSIDASSVALIEGHGVGATLELLQRLRPAVVFANADEASVLGVVGPVVGAVTVVKRGAGPATVFAAGERHDVAAESLPEVGDTTGAGDAFAAGFLAADWRGDVVGAARAGHRSAASIIARS
ncbi:MAG: PfkB family carbohydrate kinase [Ilumatobacteraceae bacterium]|nr:PfkB family carbohydrate kinase [Ilumatobacteraceae bacterium]